MILRTWIAFLLICMSCNIDNAWPAENAPASNIQDESRERLPDAGTSSENSDTPSRTVHTAPIPIFFYTPESSLAAGGSVVMTFRNPEDSPSERPDSLQLIGVYTLKHQAFVSLMPSFYFNDQKSKIHLNASYAKWPTSFFGIGNDADIGPREIDRLEETYMSESWTIQPWLTHKIISDFAVGLTGDLKQNAISKTEADGRIAQGRVEGNTGGLRSGLGPVFSWDTRDHIFFPTRGSWLKLWSWHYRNELGSEFDYDLYAMDLRWYRTFGGKHTLAFQVLGVSTDGEVPFNELPTPQIRGLYENVFVERNMVTVKSEYRFPIKNRWSGALFLAAGDVFHNSTDYDMEDLKYGGGGGIRWAVSRKEKINLRFDIGISPYGVFPYIMFQEAF